MIASHFSRFIPVYRYGKTTWRKRTKGTTRENMKIKKYLG